jgi:hypothetical protein
VATILWPVAINGRITGTRVTDVIDGDTIDALLVEPAAFGLTLTHRTWPRSSSPTGRSCRTSWCRRGMRCTGMVRVRGQRTSCEGSGSRDRWPHGTHGTARGVDRRDRRRRLRCGRLRLVVVDAARCRGSSVRPGRRHRPAVVREDVAVVVVTPVLAASFLALLLAVVALLVALSNVRADRRYHDEQRRQRDGGR